MSRREDDNDDWIGQDEVSCPFHPASIPKTYIKDLETYQPRYLDEIRATYTGHIEKMAAGMVSAESVINSLLELKAQSNKKWCNWREYAKLIDEPLELAKAKSVQSS